MAKNDFQYAGWNSYNQSINQKRIRVTKVTNVTARPLLQCGTIMTLISPSDYTLQCGMRLWEHDSEFTKWQHPAV